jgi:hypothetical protein
MAIVVVKEFVKFFNGELFCDYPCIQGVHKVEKLFKPMGFSISNPKAPMGNADH